MLKRINKVAAKFARAIRNLSKPPSPEWPSHAQQVALQEREIELWRLAIILERDDIETLSRQVAEFRYAGGTWDDKIELLISVARAGGEMPWENEDFGLIHWLVRFMLSHGCEGWK